MFVDSPASHTVEQLHAAPRRISGLLLTYCIGLPLFGRAVFPIVRDKAGITLASSFTDPQMLATYILAAILGYKVCTARNFAATLARTEVLRVFVVFVCICFVSALVSRFPLFSLWRSFEIALLPLWATLMIQDTSSGIAPSGAIHSFYAMSVAIFVGVFVGFLINPGSVWAMEGDVARLTSSSGYMIGSNEIGAIAAVLSLASYVRAVERSSIKYAFSAAVFLGICYVSHSRGSYIAFAAGFLATTFMLARLPRRRTLVLSVAIFSLVAVGATLLVSREVAGFFEFLMTRGHEIQNLESFGGRLELWQLGLRLFRERPFLGTGYGTHPDGMEGSHFHNVFIELLVVTGIIGVTCFAAFVVALFVATKKVLSRTNMALVSARVLAADMVAISVVIIVANGATVDAAYYSWDLLGLFCVAVAAGRLMRTYPTVPTETPASTRFSNILK